LLPPKAVAFISTAETGYRKKTRAPLAPRRSSPLGETRKNISHKGSRAAVSPAPAANVGAIRALPARDNVNIQLGFVIANYFSLLRSLFVTLFRRRRSPRVPASPGDSPQPRIHSEAKSSSATLVPGNSSACALFLAGSEKIFGARSFASSIGAGDPPAGTSRSGYSRGRYESRSLASSGWRLLRCPQRVHPGEDR